MARHLPFRVEVGMKHLESPANGAQFAICRFDAPPWPSYNPYSSCWRLRPRLLSAPARSGASPRMTRGLSVGTGSSLGPRRDFEGVLDSDEAFACTSCPASGVALGAAANAPLKHPLRRLHPTASAPAGPPKIAVIAFQVAGRRDQRVPA